MEELEKLLLYRFSQCQLIFLLNEGFKKRNSDRILVLKPLVIIK